MEESATYQAIVGQGLERGLEQGRTVEAREVVLLQGEVKFGPPDEATRAAINTITDLGQLHDLLVRLVGAASWQELVPSPPRRNRRRRTGD
jgi:hypothetical protein